MEYYCITPQKLRFRNLHFGYIHLNDEYTLATAYILKDATQLVHSTIRMDREGDLFSLDHEYLPFDQFISKLILTLEAEVDYRPQFALRMNAHHFEDWVDGLVGDELPITKWNTRFGQMFKISQYLLFARADEILGFDYVNEQSFSLDGYLTLLNYLDRSPLTVGTYQVMLFVLRQIEGSKKQHMPRKEFDHVVRGIPAEGSLDEMRSYMTEIAKIVS
ncbi:MAG: hypothetical protein INQ03_09455 [Candidatus Heimdallarchaeota archaeon]|nr:hypothetical protein [Candidatus Heimdallarchaeota archaeon]